MSVAAGPSHCLNYFGTPLVAEPSPGKLSGNAGLPPIRPFGQQVGLTPTVAGALTANATPRTRAGLGSRCYPAPGPVLVLGPAG